MCRFFFAEETPYGLALIRICLPLMILIDVARRWPFVRELYSSDGATAPLADAYNYYEFLPEFSGGVAVALYSMLVFSLITASAGWFTRTSLIISVVLYPYFCMLDIVSSTTKYMVIATHILLLLGCSRTGLIWSVDAWLAGGRKRDPWPGGTLQQRPMTAAWPRRLIQFLIALSYFGAAVTKVHTPAFFSGDQMQFWMMTYIYYAQPAGDYLAHYPLVSVCAAYVTLVWEILFIICAWRGRGRIWMLSLGVAFHMGTVFMLGLFIFPLLMLVAYFSFLNENDVQKFSAVWRRWKRRSAILRRVSTNARSGKSQPASSRSGLWRTSLSASLFVVGLGFGGGALLGALVRSVRSAASRWPVHVGANPRSGAPRVVAKRQSHARSR